jgi:hypothetical protein
MQKMNKFTLLDAAVGGFRVWPAGERGGEDGRRQRLMGAHDPSGERRLLFGVGEGPTEAAAGAKQVGMGVMWNPFDKGLVTEPWPRNGSTQAGVRNKMRNNDLRFGSGHASVTLRSAS